MTYDVSNKKEQERSSSKKQDSLQRDVVDRSRGDNISEDAAATETNRSKKRQDRSHKSHPPYIVIDKDQEKSGQKLKKKRHSKRTSTGGDTDVSGNKGGNLTVEIPDKENIIKRRKFLIKRNKQIARQKEAAAAKAEVER